MNGFILKDNVTSFQFIDSDRPLLLILTRVTQYDIWDMYHCADHKDIIHPVTDVAYRHSRRVYSCVSQAHTHTSLPVAYNEQLGLDCLPCIHLYRMVWCAGRQ